MGWATEYIAGLKQGNTQEFRPTGNSMSPLIESGQLCVVKPVGIYRQGDLYDVPSEEYEIHIEDIVLCRVNGKEYLHLVKDIVTDDRNEVTYQIGNNHGKINGWARPIAIYGKLVEIKTDEDNQNG